MQVHPKDVHNLILISRNHDELFKFCENSLISKIISQDNTDIAASPLMKYNNITLRLDLSDSCKKETVLYEAIVDWYTLNIKAYKESADRLHNLPCFNGLFSIPIQPISYYSKMFDQLLFECFLFVKRGHSLFQCGCTCTDSITIQRLERKLKHSNGIKTLTRLKELGLYDSSNHNITKCRCTVKSKKDMICVQSVMQELGILHGEMGIVRIYFGDESHTIYKTMSFIHALIYYGKFQLFSSLNPKHDRILINPKEIDFSNITHNHLSKLYISSSICCTPIEIKSIVDLKQAMYAYYPEPFEWNLNEKYLRYKEQKLHDDNSFHNQPTDIIPSYILAHQTILNQAKFESHTGTYRILSHENINEIQNKFANKTDLQNKLVSRLNCTSKTTFYLCDSNLETRLGIKHVDDDIRMLWKSANGKLKIDFSSIYNSFTRSISHEKFIPIHTLKKRRKCLLY